MTQRVKEIKLDNLFYKEKPTTKKTYSSLHKMAGISLGVLLLISSNLYFKSNETTQRSEIKSLHTLAQTNILESNSRKLIHTIFTQNKDNYKKNLYNLKQNEILSIQGYNNILVHMSSNGILDDLQAGVEIVSLDDLENYPYVSTTRFQDNKYEMDITVPFILVTNNKGIITKENKQYLINFRLVDNQYLVQYINEINK